jgi:hypothetical protein
MMPSAAHKTELNSTTHVPVKNSIEQSLLSRAICFSLLILWSLSFTALFMRFFPSKINWRHRNRIAPSVESFNEQARGNSVRSPVAPLITKSFPMCSRCNCWSAFNSSIP